MRKIYRKLDTSDTLTASPSNNIVIPSIMEINLSLRHFALLKRLLKEPTVMIINNIYATQSDTKLHGDLYNIQ